MLSTDLIFFGSKFSGTGGFGVRQGLHEARGDREHHSSQTVVHMIRKYE